VVAAGRRLLVWQGCLAARATCSSGNPLSHAAGGASSVCAEHLARDVKAPEEPLQVPRVGVSAPPEGRCTAFGIRVSQQAQQLKTSASQHRRQLGFELLMCSVVLLAQLGRARLKVPTSHIFRQ
jgi:hypothetical protein